MLTKYRQRFDREAERVLAALPKSVLQLMEEVPLHIEDQPSKRLRQELQIEHSDELCGYFFGVPLNERNSEAAGVPLPGSVTIFRKGIIAEAGDDSQTTFNWRQVRRQIRITILHEYAHLHGMDEDEIAEMGYG